MSTTEDRHGADAETRAVHVHETVVFYLAGEPDFETLRSLDPDDEPEHFRSGERSWVVQTYLRLRAAGWPVELSDRPPDSGMVVFHAKHKRALARAAGDRPGPVFVAIRADNSSPLLADFEVLQNGRFDNGRTRFRVAHWPQPGLVPRDTARGTRVTTVGYMGLEENLHPEFRSAAWQADLAEIGVEWKPRMTRFRPNDQSRPVKWEDYSDLDIVLAMRPVKRTIEYAKPPSKLVNAWRAGIPALIGHEYPYRELRRSPTDYIEIRGRTDALAAVRRLRDNPDLYLEMVANGACRAEEFSFERITEEWARLLFTTIPRRIAEGELCWTRRLPIPLRVSVRRLRQLIRGERAR